MDTPLVFPFQLPTLTVTLYVQSKAQSDLLSISQGILDRASASTLSFPTSTENLKVVVS